MRATIVDNDMFPDYRFKPYLFGEFIDAKGWVGEAYALPFAFIKSVFLRIHGVFWLTIVRISWDQLHNVYAFFTMYIRCT